LEAYGLVEYRERLEVEGLTLRTLQNLQVLIGDFNRDYKLRGMTEESIRRYVSSLKYLQDSL